MHKRIALFGCFDLANFGDHLYPLIIEKFYQNQNINIELDLYSIYEGIESFGTGKEVNSVFNLEQKHLETPYDLFLIGGGEIIHYLSCKHKYKEEEKVYPMCGNWVIPSIIGKKYNIPIILNCPGIPFDFYTPYESLTKYILSGYSYMAVRNISSKNAIEKITETSANIDVYYDLAFLINDFVDLDNKERFIKDDKYAVFHFNKMLAEKDFEYLNQTIKDLSEKGYKIYLLPLAYCNDDIEFLENYCNNHLKEIANVISQRLNLEDIINILGNSDLYCGLSYHGAIIAYCYNKPVVSMDYPCQRKTKDLFNKLNLDKFYLNDLTNLKEICNDALTKKSDIKNHTPEIKEKLYKYLHNTIEYLNNDSTFKPEPRVGGGRNPCYELILHLTEISEYKNKTDSKISQLSNYNNELLNLNNELSNEIYKLRIEVEKLNQEIEKQKEENNIKTNKLNTIYNSKYWKYTKLFRKLEKINEQ